jgi:hypothetical protein
MKKLIATLLFIFWPGLLLSSAQQALFFSMNVRPASGGCTAPTATHRWAIYDTNTTCVSGGACSSGGSINFVKDLVGADDSTQIHSGHEPAYSPAAINSLAAGDFSSGIAWMMETTIPIPSGANMSVYAVVFYDASTSTNESILGNEGSGGSFNWRFDANNKQEILSSGTASIASSSVAYTTAGWHTFEVDFNQTTGAYAFKHCTGGTCSVDTSGTASVPSFFNSSNTFGADNATNTFWTGKIAEFGYFSGFGVTGLGAWSQCQYGI